MRDVDREIVVRLSDELWEAVHRDARETNTTPEVIIRETLQDRYSVIVSRFGVVHTSASDRGISVMSNREYALDPSDLAKLMPLYQRWVSEGKPPYMHSYNPDQPQQYYYDSYHESIRENDDGTFRFDVQTYDSPEGDTWVRGTFRVENGQVTIIEQKAYAN